MKTPISVLASLLFVSAMASAQTVIIDALESTGRLSATVPSNSVYSIEWKGALSNPEWKNDWSRHRDVLSTNGSIDVEIPMAFQLTCWTNGLFLDLPIGRTYHYSVSNAVGQTWRQEIEVLGDTYMPDVDQSYRMVRVVEFYTNADDIPFGAQRRNVRFMRTDESHSYHYDSFYSNDVLEHQAGTNGTTWSYFSSSFDWTNVVTIVDHTDVTVSTTNGPVTYPDCIEYFTDGLENGFNWQTNFPVRTFKEWISPEGYLVRRENSLLGAGLEPFAPVVYELQGWVD